MNTFDSLSTFGVTVLQADSDYIPDVRLAYQCGSYAGYAAQSHGTVYDRDIRT